MAKMTVLDMVQDILNDLESDPINSINDSIEAQAIAQTIKTTFYNIIENKDYPHQYNIIQLEALGDITKPNYMKIADTIESVKWVKYNTRKANALKDAYTTIKYKTQEDFLDLVNARDSSLATIEVVQDYSGVSINVITNKAPQYYTSFDDVHLIFDSYDLAVDSTLQQSKSSSFGKRHIEFTISDNFIPDMPVQMFMYLLNEAKSTVFVNSKQTQNPKAEMNAVIQRRKLSQEAWKLANGITYPSYGRK